MNDALAERAADCVSGTMANLSTLLSSTGRNLSTLGFMTTGDVPGSDRDDNATYLNITTAESREIPVGYVQIAVTSPPSGGSSNFEFRTTNGQPYTQDAYLDQLEALGFHPLRESPMSSVSAASPLLFLTPWDMLITCVSPPVLMAGNVSDDVEKSHGGWSLQPSSCVFQVQRK
jgi:hypothetical protein